MQTVPQDSFIGLKFADNINSYILMNPDMAPVEEGISICTWNNKLKSGNSPYLLKYNAPGAIGEIEMFDASQGFTMLQQYTSSGIKAPLGWHHQCLTWSFATKTTKFYYNGSLHKSATTRSLPDRKLAMGGSIAIGQNHLKTNLEADFNGQAYSFGGAIRDLNIFTVQLRDRDVSKMYRSGMCSDSVGFLQLPPDIIFLKWDILLNDLNYQTNPNLRSNKVKEFYMNKCPSPPSQVDGGYSAYGDWLACSAECDGGTQTRTRQCNSPAPTNGGYCEGDNSESQKCNEQPCPATTVTCSNDKMSLALVDDGSYETIHLEDVSDSDKCEFAGTLRTFDVQHHKCGTTVELNETMITYKNQVTLTGSAKDLAAGISRGNKKIPFQCSYPRSDTISPVKDKATWTVPGQTVSESITGEGSLTFTLEMHPDNGFSKKMSAFPYAIDIGDEIFMMVSVDSLDPKLIVGVTKVTAKDSTDSNDNSNQLSYDLYIKESCKQDATLSFMTDSDLKKKKFKFKSFSFIKDTKTDATPVFIHATVKVCRDDDDDSCDETCDPARRRKRSSKEDEDRYHVYQGPIIAKTNLLPSSAVDQKSNILLIASTLCLCCYFIFAYK